MSCGNHHDTPCSDVLDRVYSYLDGELDETGCADIRQHLDECGPCLEEYGLEKVVKQLVAKHCGCDPVPDDLRDKVLTRIEQVRAQLAE
jgi:mycothiol system anti-sigma-R factor